MKPRMSRSLVLAPVFAAFLGVSGCLSVLPEPEIPSALITLPAERAKAPDQQLQADISVSSPDSSRAFAGTDIAVRDDQELIYLGDVRWADTAPRLLQGAVIEALSKAGGAGRATPAQLGARVDYELRWRIIDFSVGAGTAPVNAEVEASLMDAMTRRVVAQSRFSASATPAGVSPRERGAALAIAAQDVADQTAAFVAGAATPLAPPAPR
jgi:ABC-type uncharacterized transport system auxiliary subunit